jgi:hypothetical protein
MSRHTANPGGMEESMKLFEEREPITARRLWECVWFTIAACLLAVGFACIVGIWKANAQHNHDEGHPDYQNWASGKTSNCCNDKDCGDLNEDETREGDKGTKVLILKKWCPVKAEHYIIKGKSPDWNKPHACVNHLGYYDDPCDRLLCFAGKGGW